MMPSVGFALLAGLALTACQFHRFHDPLPGCSVTVGATEARLIFPAVHKKDWIWNRNTGSVPNYSWSVYLLAPGVHLEVGRDAKGPEQHGDLAAMMQSARVFITWPSSGPAEFDDFREIPSLHPFALGNRPALLIRDSAILRELFWLNHPTVADCRFLTADGVDGGGGVDSVRYLESR